MIIVTVKTTNKIANKNITPAGLNVYRTMPIVIERNIQKNAEINVESVL